MNKIKLLFAALAVLHFTLMACFLFHVKAEPYMAIPALYCYVTGIICLIDFTKIQ